MTWSPNESGNIVFFPFNIITNQNKKIKNIEFDISNLPYDNETIIHKVITLPEETKLAGYNDNDNNIKKW